MDFNMSLFAQLIRETPFQPATNYWRTIEIETLSKEMFPSGLGLDLGCGDGRLASIVFGRIGNRELVGLDLDPAELVLAASEGAYTRLHEASAESIPERDETFAFVFSNSVLEHIPNLDRVLDEIVRVLMHGGRLIVTVPSDGFHACLRGPVLPCRKRLRYLADIDRRCAHVHYWSETRWQDELRLRGMRVVSLMPYLDRKEVQHWEWLARFTSGLATTILGNRKRPIEIQRKMGMRGQYRWLPYWVARILAYLLGQSLTPKSDEDKRLHACLLVVAEKP